MLFSPSLKLTPLTETLAIGLHSVMQVDYGYHLLHRHLQQEVLAKLVQHPTCDGWHGMEVGMPGIAHKGLCSSQMKY